MQAAPAADDIADTDDGRSDDVTECMRYDGSTWKQLATWGKLTGAIQPFHRRIAYSIGDRIQRAIPPSDKQAAIGVVILRTAREAGYSFPSAREAGDAS
jgi:hypothetical protein